MVQELGYLPFDLSGNGLIGKLIHPENVYDRQPPYSLSYIQVVAVAFNQTLGTWALLAVDEDAEAFDMNNAAWAMHLDANCPYCPTDNTPGEDE